jgi:hypothetical protein
MDFKKGDRVALIPEGLWDEEQRGNIRYLSYVDDVWANIDFDRKFSGHGRAVHISRIRKLTIYDMMKDNILNNQGLTKVKKKRKTH